MDIQLKGVHTMNKENQPTIKEQFKKFCAVFSKICLGIAIGVTICTIKTIVINEFNTQGCLYEIVVDTQSNLNPKDK